ncbi:MAG TPA: hypothetical protein VNT57_03725 [Desulfobacteria bacterium]|nr:hypothetical protein [Desulfobacteria bacterium]
MKLKGNCMSTAMGILPHKDIEEAMKLAFNVDIPFWPQLPHVNFYEDMYVQVTENFPGITVDDVNYKISFDTARFYEELPLYVENYENDDFFRIAGKYSAVYHRFLNDPRLKNYDIIRGQSIGPISFGLKIADENKRPIIYNDEVKSFLYEFMAKKINVERRELAEINPNAFVWIDEPGLSFIFGSFTGYTAEVAKKDYRAFIEQLEGPKGVHLCGNPDWSFLLELDLDILSIDVLSNGPIFIKYVDQLKNFLDKGGIISWGIVPTLTEEFVQESIDTLIGKMEEMWNYLDAHGIPKEQVISQAWIAPARCCLVNLDGNETVEKAFNYLNEVSRRLKEKYSLD